MYRLVMADDGNGDDSFDWPEEPLDDSFIFGASISEPSAEERLAREDRLRRQAALRARLESGEIEDPLQYRYGATADSQPGAGAIQNFRTKRRTRWRRTQKVVAVIAAFALIAYMYQRPPTSSISDSLPDFTGAEPEFDSLTGAESTSPTPQPAQSSERLIDLPQEPPFDDSFKFAQIQDDGTVPVTYDPCRPIRYVTNSSQAPPNGDAMVDESIGIISAATGLLFEDWGEADEVPTSEREPFQPDVYGDQWAPVLISWTDPGQIPALGGDVAGIGGSTYFARDSDEPFTYVTGIVFLDAPALSEISEFPDGDQYARAVVIHELAHLVGLDHVDDPTQLMNPQSIGLTGLADGDRTGLYQLGQGECRSEL